jgi:hypothetical protein
VEECGTNRYTYISVPAFPTPSEKERQFLGNKPSRNDHSIAKQLNKEKRNDQANFEASIKIASSELN